MEARAATANVRVDGAPAEATLDSAELRWRRAGRTEERERRLSLEDEVLGVEARGKEVVVRAFVLAASRSRSSCVGAGGRGTRRRRKDFVFEMADGEGEGGAAAWAGRVRACLDSFGRPKRLFVFVNPFGGKKCAKKIYKTEIRPLFEAANVSITMQETEYQGHAREVASSLDLAKYDGIVCVSGDGVLVEPSDKYQRAPDRYELATARAPRPPPGAAPATATFPASSTPKTLDPRSSLPPSTSPTTSLPSGPFHGQIEVPLPRQILQPQPAAALDPSPCSAPRAPFARRRPPPRRRRGGEALSATISPRPPAPGLVDAAGELKRAQLKRPEAAQPPFPDKATRGCSTKGNPGRPCSYREALLGGAKTVVPGIAVDKQSCPECRRSKKLCVQSPAPPPSASTTADADEGWQVVGPRRRQARQDVQSQPARPPCPRYLAAVAGRCFNCLSSAHRVATCRLPTRCFNCYGLRHRLRDCKLPRKPPASQPPSGYVASDVGRRAVRASSVSRNTFVSKSPRNTVSHLGRLGGSNSCKPEDLLHVHQTRATNFETQALDQKLVHNKDMKRSRPEMLDTSVELQPCRETLEDFSFEVRSWDPMVDEAAMAAWGNTPRTKCCGSQGVRDMAVQLAKEPLEEMLEVYVGAGSTPSPTAMSLPIVSHHPEDIQTPLMVRSEEEQQIGQELIKALSNLKHSMVGPLSPCTQQHTSLENEKAIVVHSEVNQICSRQPEVKSEKPAFKVVRDMLTKNWIFVKEVKQVGDWTLQRFLHACKKRVSASRIENIRHQTEMAMLMKAVKKLQASDKRKK